MARTKAISTTETDCEQPPQHQSSSSLQALDRSCDSTPNPKRKGRKVDLDNCKCIFMFFVVVYHCFNNWILEEATRDWSTTWKNVFLSYTLWHERLAVPGFCFLSGLMGKGYCQVYCRSSSDHDDYSKNNNQKLKKRWEASVSTLLIGTILIQLLNAVMKAILWKLHGVDGNNNDNGNTKEETTVTNTTLSPIWPNNIFDWDFLETWYLVALFVWRLLTPLWMNLWKYPFTTSLVIAIVLSAHTDWGWNAHVQYRIFRYFPYYVAGLLIDPSVLDRISSNKKTSRIIAMGGILSTLFVAIHLQYEHKIRFFSIVYLDMDWSWQSHVIMLFQYTYSSVAVLSVIVFVKQSSLLSNVPLFPWGHANSTLAIYCWHWRVLDVVLWGKVPFSNSNIHLWDDHRKPLLNYFQSCTSGTSIIWSWRHPMVAIVALHFVCYVICVVLGSQVIWNYVFRYINDPPCDFLFLKR